MPEVDLKAVRATIAQLNTLGGSRVELHSKGEHVDRTTHARRTAKAQAGKRPRKPRVLRRRTARKSIPNALLILWHEFGMGVPQRSWIRRGLAEHATTIERGIRSQVQVIVAKRGKHDLRKTHALVGKLAIEGLRRTVQQRIPPPLAASTKANPDRDRRYIPLVDTGQLRASLAWEGRGL